MQKLDADLSEKLKVASADEVKLTEELPDQKKDKKLSEWLDDVLAEDVAEDGAVDAVVANATEKKFTGPFVKKIASFIQAQHFEVNGIITDQGAGLGNMVVQLPDSTGKGKTQIREECGPPVNSVETMIRPLIKTD